MVSHYLSLGSGSIPKGIEISFPVHKPERRRIRSRIRKHPKRDWNFLPGGYPTFLYFWKHPKRDWKDTTQSVALLRGAVGSIPKGIERHKPEENKEIQKSGSIPKGIERLFPRQSIMYMQVQGSIPKGIERLPNPPSNIDHVEEASQKGLKATNERNWIFCIFCVEASQKGLKVFLTKSI